MENVTLEGKPYHSYGLHIAHLWVLRLASGFTRPTIGPSLMIT